jgi:hypothetical protein
MGMALKQREPRRIGHPHFLVAEGALIVPNPVKPTALHDNVLVSAASQAPVPLPENMKGWPVSVLKTFLSCWNNPIVNSGNFDDRWSSMATIMARITRSGTFVKREAEEDWGKKRWRWG